MSSSQRKAVKQALRSLKFTDRQSAAIESMIHKMCKSLLNEESESNIEEMYTTYAYEKIGHLGSNPSMRAEIIKDIREGVEGWNSSVFEKWRKLENKDTSEQAAGMKVEKGVFKCRSRTCRSDECAYYSSQSRSLDELATVHIVCIKCGHRYTLN